MDTDQPLGHLGPLEEFKALRVEIDRRSNIQHGVLGLEMASGGALASVALADKSHIAVLLVLPVLSLILGAQWYDQHVYIHHIGEYIRDHLHPAIPGGLRWQSMQIGGGGRRDRILGLMAAYGVFPIVSFGALMALSVERVGKDNPVWAIAFWFVGLVALAHQIWILIRLWIRKD